MQKNMLGHNSEGATLRVEVRLFNSLSRYGEHGRVCHHVEIGPGATIGDLMRRFKLPVSDIFLVLRNGRDVTPGLFGGGTVNEKVVLEDDDVVAFSGPVPYSYGYGSPVV
ncbi:MAG: MoaD/ThiS family protein [Hyphomicrobiaceae bacterium]